MSGGLSRPGASFVFRAISLALFVSRMCLLVCHATIRWNQQRTSFGTSSSQASGERFVTQTQVCHYQVMSIAYRQEHIRALLSPYLTIDVRHLDVSGVSPLLSSTLQYRLFIKVISLWCSSPCGHWSRTRRAGRQLRPPDNPTIILSVDIAGFEATKRKRGCRNNLRSPTYRSRWSSKTSTRL